MSKKFELIKNDSIEIDDYKLYRIRALIDFKNVKAGDLGGYVENENNLSQMGDCWIYDNARVYDRAYIADDAKVFNNACVSGNARVYDRTYIADNAYLSDNARVYDNAYIADNAIICGNAEICGNAYVADNAYVTDNARVYDNACVYDNAWVFGSAHISGDAIIKKESDYIVFKNTWSSRRYFTYTKSNKMWRVGCFYGDGYELIRKAYKDSENSGKNYKLYVNQVKEMEKLDNEND